MHDELLGLLRRDHRQVEKLLAELAAQADGSPAKKAELFRDLFTELVPHLRAEERRLYPELSRHGEARQDAAHALDEHRKAEAVLNEMGSMDPQDPRWDRCLRTLRRMIERHVRWEEDSIFSLARQVLSREVAARILEEVRKEKEVVTAAM